MKLENLLQQAREGDVMSAFYLGYYYASGEDKEIPLNVEHAIYWYSISANRGSAAAHYNVGLLLVESQAEDIRALFHFEAAAELGNADAALTAAEIHELGETEAFTIKINLAKALYFYRLALELGNRSTEVINKITQLAKQLKYDVKKLPPIRIIPNLTNGDVKYLTALANALDQVQQERAVIDILIKESHAKISSREQELQNKLQLHRAEAVLLEKKAEQLSQRTERLTQKQQYFDEDKHQFLLQQTTLKLREEELQQRENAWREHKNIEQKNQEEMRNEKSKLEDERKQLEQLKLNLKTKENQLSRIEDELAQARQTLVQDKEQFNDTCKEQEEKFQEKLAEQKKQQQEILDQEYEKLHESKKTIEEQQQKLKINVEEVSKNRQKLNEAMQMLKTKQQALSAEREKLEKTVQQHQTKIKSEFIVLQEKERELAQQSQKLQSFQKTLVIKEQALEVEKQKLLSELGNIKEQEKLLQEVTDSQLRLQERQTKIDKDMRVARTEGMRAENLRQLALTAEQNARAAQLRAHEAEEVLRLQLRINKDSNHFLQAIQNESIATIQTCLQIGLDPNRQDIEGNTPLHYVVLYGIKNSVEMLEVLLEANANPTLTNKSNRTPLQLLQATKRNPNYSALLKILQAAELKTQQVKSIALFKLLAPSGSVLEAEKNIIDSKFDELQMLHKQIAQLYYLAIKVVPDREEELSRFFKDYGQHCFAAVLTTGTTHLPSSEIIRADLYLLQNNQKKYAEQHQQSEKKLRSCQMRIALLLRGMNLTENEVEQYYRDYHCFGFDDMPGLTAEKLLQQVKPLVDKDIQSWKNTKSFTEVSLISLDYPAVEAKKIINSKNEFKWQIIKQTLEPERKVLQQLHPEQEVLSNFFNCIVAIIDNEYQLQTLNSEQLLNANKYFLHWQQEKEKLTGRKPRRVIKCKDRTFEFWHSFNREEAQQVYQQTGYVIAFDSSEQQLKQKHVIGEGKTGKVRVAYDLNQKQFVSVKKSKAKEGDEIWASLKESNNGRRLHEKLNGLPHILPLYDSMMISKKYRNPAFYIFSELGGFGDGSALLKKLTFLNNATQQLKFIMHVGQSILHGMNSIHKKSIYHCDLKIKNFVITKTGVVNIIDFDLSKELQETLITDFHVEADTRYFSPEHFAHARYLERKICTKANVACSFQSNEEVSCFHIDLSDAWSVGLTLLELMLQSYPFPLANYEERHTAWDSQFLKKELEKCFNSEKFTAFEKINPLFCGMVRGLLMINPMHRFTIKKALERCDKPAFLNQEECEQAFTQLAKLTDLIESEEPAEDTNYTVVVSKN